jgi:hypothetical protein
MSEHPQKDHGAGYETADVSAGPTLRAGIYILLAMFVTAAILVPLYDLFVREEKAGQAPAATALKTDTKPAPPQGPRLLTAEDKTLAAFRAQEDALLTGYGWAEKDKGIVRIPVDEAMRIVVERGMPAFPAAAASPAPGGAP